MSLMMMADDDFIERWSSYQRMRGFSDRTIDRRTWTLSKWSGFLDGLPMIKATADDVEAFIGRYPGAQTRYSMLADLRMFYRWLAQRDLIDRDPTARVDSPRVPKRAPTPIAAADVRRVIESADRDVRRMLLLGAYAGLRCSEIASIRGEDIDLRAELLVVRSGKGGKDRIVPLAPELASELVGVGTGPLFPHLNGQRVGTAIRRTFRRCGVTGRPHDLRHSFGTEVARRANGNLVMVAQLMGHSSVTTTERYVRWVPENRHAVEGLYV